METFLPTLPRSISRSMLGLRLCSLKQKNEGGEWVTELYFSDSHIHFDPASFRGAQVPWEMAFLYSAGLPLSLVLWSENAIFPV